MAEYRIDDLAQAAGSTVRNVRAYQERGLIPPPRRHGRVGIYDDTHLARLQLIGRLLDRGYTINNIDELFTAWERGRDLGDVLGLEQVVSSFFTHELPQNFTREQLVAVLAPGADQARADEVVATAVAAGLVTTADEDRFDVPSPRLFSATRDLITAGVPPHAVFDLGAQLQRAVDDVAQRFVGIMADYLFRGRDADWMPSPDEIPALADFVERIRPATSNAVHTALAHALDRHVSAAFGEYIDRLTPHLPSKRSARTEPA